MMFEQQRQQRIHPYGNYNEKNNFQKYGDKEQEESKESSINKKQALVKKKNLNVIKILIQEPQKFLSPVQEFSVFFDYTVSLNNSVVDNNVSNNFLYKKYLSIRSINTLKFPEFGKKFRIIELNLNDNQSSTNAPKIFSEYPNELLVDILNNSQDQKKKELAEVIKGINSQLKPKFYSLMEQMQRTQRNVNEAELYEKYYKSLYQQLSIFDEAYPFYMISYSTNDKGKLFLSKLLFSPRFLKIIDLDEQNFCLNLLEKKYFKEFLGCQDYFENSKKILTELVSKPTQYGMAYTDPYTTDNIIKKYNGENLYTQVENYHSQIWLKNYMEFNWIRVIKISNTYRQKLDTQKSGKWAMKKFNKQTNGGVQFSEEVQNFLNQFYQGVEIPTDDTSKRAKRRKDKEN